MAQFVTPEAARERFRELADQVEAAYDEMRALSSAEVGNEFRVELAERLETQERTNRGLMYRVFGEIADPPDESAMVPVLADKLWARLRIPPREIKRRMKMAARIRPRRQLSGPPLAPELPRVAAAVEAGTIGEDHLRVISRAVDIVKAAVRHIDEIFNPDGDLTRPTGRGAADCSWAGRDPTACRGCRDGSTPTPAAMWRRSPPRCVPAGTCPTPPWPR